MRKLSSVFLAIILLLATSMAQVRCETKVDTNIVKPLSTGTVPISGDLQNAQWKWFGPWGGAGSKITAISVQVYWTPTSCGCAVEIEDQQTHAFYDYPVGSFLYGGALSHTFQISGDAQYHQWKLGVTAKTNDGYMHFYGVAYIIYG
jgi:hypothetical protein